MDVVLGTAGHIDHGKTSLVRALTGINCDRLQEERRRGITIELGFAWLDLPDGRRLGIVDVPGHEKFVKNMVAGAAGIDCMLLVIAADEGIMPQTREHLDICTLLGVSSGIVALTKTDMVDEAWLEMVREDVQSCLKGTFLEGAPIYEVSSATGAGLEALKKGIANLVASLAPRQRSGILRLPVDRVFTLKGFGTVVTGTLISGVCRQGDEICLVPSGKTAKVRSLQVHGEPKKEGHPGQRCAMNLQNIEVTEIGRGDVVTKPNSLFPSRRWIVLLTCLPSSPHPLKQRMEVHFHHGSRECAARILFRDRDELAQGESAIAEIRFSEPMAGVFGDHCVLRAHSPLRTIAGGILLDPLPQLLRKRDPQFAHKFAMLKSLGQISEKEDESLSTSQSAELVEIALALRGVPGSDEKRLAALTALPANILANSLANLESAKKAICWDVENRQWVSSHAFEISLKKCSQRAAELHEREPLKGFFAHNALCSGWGADLPAKYTQKVLDESVKRGILKAEGNGLKLAEHTIRLDEGQAVLKERMLEIYKNGNLMPPTLKELSESIGGDLKKSLSLVSHLCETGSLVKIQDGLYYHKPVLERILNDVRAWFNENDNLDVGAMKTMFGISRKYAIPLLEYMDAARITFRVGNSRQLFNNVRK